MSHGFVMSRYRREKTSKQQWHGEKFQENNVAERHKLHGT